MGRAALDYLVTGADTGTVPPESRVDFWRAHVTDNHGVLHFVFPSGDDFHGGTRVQRAGRVQVVDFWSDAIGYERRAADIDRDGDDGVRMVVPATGQVFLDAAGRRSCVRPGGAAVLSMTRPFRLEHDAHTRAFIISLPGSAATSLRQHDVPLLLETGRGPGAVTATMLAEISAQRSTLDAETFVAATEAAFDLITRGIPDLAPFVEQARALVTRSCADPAYDPPALARELGVSLRSLQLRLSEASTSPAALIREARLQGAARLLSRAAWDDRTISSVAHASGFASLNAFNSGFRERFGCTPGDYRRGSR